MILAKADTHSKRYSHVIDLVDELGDNIEVIDWNITPVEDLDTPPF